MRFTDIKFKPKNVIYLTSILFGAALLVHGLVSSHRQAAAFNSESHVKRVDTILTFGSQYEASQNLNR